MPDWLSLLPQAGQGSGIPEFALNALNAQSNRAQNDAQTQLFVARAAQTAQEAQAKAAQDTQYQADVANMLAITDPKKQTVAISNLIYKYPDKAKEIGQGASLRTEDAQRSDLAHFGGIVSAIDAGRGDLAVDSIQQRIAADKAAGLDTSAEESWLPLLKGGDKKALAYVRGAVLAHIGAADPERFSQNFKTAAEPGEGFSLTAGGKRYDNQGNVIAAAPFAPRVVPIPHEDGTVEYKIFDPNSASGPVVSGGGQANGASSGRYKWGWTPRARNGGDNSDAAVNNKAKIAQNMLGGIGYDDDISRFTPLQIAQAMTAGEGGKGSLADRNNNPANLTDGKGGYRKFATKDAGLQAAAAQVARNLRRGQTTLRTMIEGVPVSGAQSSPVPQSSGGTFAVGKKPPSGGADSPNAMLDDDTANFMAQQYLSGDKSVLTNLGRGKQGAENVIKVRRAILNEARNRGFNAADVAAQMVQFQGDAAAMRTAGTRSANADLAVTEAQKLIPLALKASDDVPRSSFLPFSKAEQVYRNNTNDPTYRRFVASNNALVNVYARAISPTGQPALADKEHAREILNTAYDNASYRAAVRQLAQEMAAAKSSPAAVRRDLYNNVGGRMRSPTQAPPSKGWGKAVRVN